MGEWKWLFVRCCDCNSRISNATDCLILCQEGRSAARMFDTDDPSVLKMDYIYWRSGSSFNCYDLRKLTDCSQIHFYSLTLCRLTHLPDPTSCLIRKETGHRPDSRSLHHRGFSLPNTYWPALQPIQINTRYEVCLTVNLHHEIKWNANLMQQCNLLMYS